MISITLTPEDVEILWSLGIQWDDGCVITCSEVEEIREILEEIRELSSNEYGAYHANRLVRWS